MTKVGNGDLSANERRSFVLNTSITEIILLLFFLLLLLLTFFLAQQATERHDASLREKKLTEEKHVLEQQVKDLETKLNVILAGVRLDQRSEVQKVLVSLSQLEFALAAKGQELTDLENRIKAYEQLALKLKQGLPLEKIKDDELKDLGKLATCGEAQEKVGQLTRELEQERGGRNLTERDAEQRIREAMDKVRRCGGKGEEFVACWRDEGGQIQYMFNTTLVAGGIEVARAWPEERSQEMEKHREAGSLVGRTVTLEEFNEKTQGIFDDSKKVPCRHFVRIYGKRSEMNPARFRDYRGIQDHFYHWSGVN